MWKITTGARLHCGLLETAPGQPFRFGGIGMMVAQPEIIAVLKRDPLSGRTETSGSIAKVRVDKQISLAEALSNYQHPQGGRIEILQLPPQHAGFGTGTQLACAVSSLIKCQWMHTAQNGTTPFDQQKTVQLNRVWESTTELLQWSGRGKRSTIGAFGFLGGGLIVDHGHNELGYGQLGNHLRSIGPLAVLLATPKQNVAVTGGEEDRLMAQVALKPNPHRQEMWELISSSIVPAAQQQNWELFGEALHEYGKLAGLQFAAIQGGIYRNDQVAELVARMHRLGLGGVCQSSWGPTVFGLSADFELAARIAKQLSAFYGEDVQVQLTELLNHGATIELLE